MKDLIYSTVVAAKNSLLIQFVLHATHQNFIMINLKLEIEYVVEHANYGENMYHAQNVVKL